MSQHYLIVGLGNPGQAYENTRHNVGFWAIDALAEHLKPKKGEGLSWQHTGKPNALWTEIKRGPRTIALMKPNTFMNLSGEAVKAYLNLNPELELSNMLVIYDDIDLPVGRVRIRPSGSAGTHNGLASVIECLESEQFPRLRLGVGPYEKHTDLARFVLEPFALAQEPVMRHVCLEVPKMVANWLHQGVGKTANQYNGVDYQALMAETANTPPQ